MCLEYSAQLWALLLLLPVLEGVELRAGIC